MIYLKATAEIVMLDNQDVATSYLSDAQNALKNLEKTNQEAYDRLMTGDSRVLHQGALGLAHLLEDLAPEHLNIVNDILNGLNSSEKVVSSSASVQVEIEADSLGKTCDPGHRDWYDADEEADSFDSEW